MRSHWLLLAVCSCGFLNTLNGAFLINSEEKPIYSDSLGNCFIPDTLQQEIENYKPIVERIAQEIVFGKYAGDTWLR